MAKIISSTMFHAYQRNIPFQNITAKYILVPRFGAQVLDHVFEWIPDSLYKVVHVSVHTFVVVRAGPLVGFIVVQVVELGRGLEEETKHWVRTP